VLLLLLPPHRDESCAHIPIAAELELLEDERSDLLPPRAELRHLRELELICGERRLLVALPPGQAEQAKKRALLLWEHRRHGRRGEPVADVHREPVKLGH
jgi:hypothetical protein